MKIKIIFQDAGDSPDAPQPREMIDMEATFEKLEHELQEVKLLLIVVNSAIEIPKTFIDSWGRNLLDFLYIRGPPRL